LVATVSHFPELKTELEVLGFGRSTDLIEDRGLRFAGITCCFFGCP
jgi:hypothetical protein